MKPQGVFKSLLAVSLLLFTVSAVGGPEAALPSFSVLPGSPVAGRGVLFRDTAEVAGAFAWHWDFGDGETSESPSPVHVYRLPGDYPVTLTVLTGSGSRVIKRAVEVSADNALRLLGGRFEVTLRAVDQRTGRVGEGLAIPQNDLFGIFAIPDLTSNPDNPEMFVKMLDGRVLNNFFWFFYNGLTDLDVTLTVRDMQTGVVKTYRKEPGSACGGFDTAAFSGSSVTATPTPPGPTPTPTPTPTRTPTPTEPAPTPTRTPTPPSGTTVVNLVATQFQWTFDGGGNTFQMRVGQSYELRISNGDPAGSNPHSFTGIPLLGIQGTVALTPGGAAIIRNFTPASNQVGPPRPFECGLSTCGPFMDHNNMRGSIQVVP